MKEKSAMQSPRALTGIGLVIAMLMAGLAFAQSVTVHSDTAAPIQADVQDSQAAESVTLDANLIIGADATLDGSGWAQANLVCNVNGGGTGDRSGAAYQLAGGDTTSLTTSGPLPADVAFACRLHLIGQSPETDQIVVAHLLATIDGNGQTTVALRDLTTP